MQALVEGRHATGENAFRVTSQFKWPGDAKSDDEAAEVNEVKHDSPGIAPDNSFEIYEGPQSFEKPFSDWVCTKHHFRYITLNKKIYRVLVPLRQLKSSP
jgi:hypothetical protein